MTFDFPKNYQYLTNQQHTLPKLLNMEQLHTAFLQLTPPQEATNPTLFKTLFINQGTQISARNLVYRTTTSTELRGFRILCCNSCTLYCPKAMKQATLARFSNNRNAVCMQGLVVQNHIGTPAIRIFIT